MNILRPGDIQVTLSSHRLQRSYLLLKHQILRLENTTQVKPMEPPFFPPLLNSPARFHPNSNRKQSIEGKKQERKDRKVRQQECKKEERERWSKRGRKKRWKQAGKKRYKLSKLQSTVELAVTAVIKLLKVFYFRDGLLCNLWENGLWSSIRKHTHSHRSIRDVGISGSTALKMSFGDCWMLEFQWRWAL